MKMTSRLGAAFAVAAMVAAPQAFAQGAGTGDTGQGGMMQGGGTMDQDGTSGMMGMMQGGGMMDQGGMAGMMGMMQAMTTMMQACTNMMQAQTGQRQPTAPAPDQQGG